MENNELKAENFNYSFKKLLLWEVKEGEHRC